MENNKITYKQACEHIEKSGILVDEKGNHPSAKDIFNYSGTGELFKISEWYILACKKLGYEA